MPAKRTQKLQAVATVEEVADFRSACEAVGLAPSETLRSLVSGFVGQVKAKKSIRLPLQIRFK